MRTRKWWVWLSVSSLVATVLLTGCSNSPGQALSTNGGASENVLQKEALQAKSEAEVTVALEAEATSLDPWNSTDSDTLHILSTIFEGLLTMDENGEVVPVLARTSAELEIVKVVVQAVDDAYGVNPLLVPGVGGSLPDYVWTQILGVPSVMVPYANADEANHAPNENMVVDLFYKGISCTCHVLHRLGEFSRKAT